MRTIYVVYGCIDGCSVSEQQDQRDLDGLPVLLKLRLSWMNKPHLLSEYTRCMDWQIAQARQPYTPRQVKWPFPESENDGVGQLIYPHFERFSENFLLSEAKDVLLITRLALHAFRLEHGRFPNSLQDLVPRDMPQLPRDPFNAVQPLRYRLAPLRFQKFEIFQPGGEPIQPVKSPASPLPAAPPGDGAVRVPQYDSIPFTLYSVGFDARDDGAKPYEFDRTGARHYNLTFNPRDQNADIVGGING